MEDKEMDYYILLQTNLVSLLIKKQCDLKRKKIEANIINNSKEYHKIQHQLSTLEKRIMDVEWLMKLHEEADEQCMNMNKTIEMLSKYNINKILYKLKGVLKCLSVLQTKNFIMPETEQEITHFLSTIEKCSQTLDNLKLDKFNNIFEEVQMNLNTFSSNATDVENMVKELLNNVSELQNLSIKYASDSFAEM